jgi:hypothetical protein
MRAVGRSAAGQLLLKVAHNFDIEMPLSVVKGRSEVTQLVEPKRWKDNAVLEKVAAMYRCRLLGERSSSRHRVIWFNGFAQQLG